MCRILLIGKNGRLARELSKLDFPKEILGREDFYDFFHIDSIADKIISTIREFSPTVIINAMAMNGMEACEDHPCQAIHSNIQLPAILAGISSFWKIPLIHFSSDYAIADQIDQVPIEELPYIGNSCGLYGWTKRVGEQAARINPRHLIFRVSSIYTSRDLDGSLGPVKRILSSEWKGEKEIKVLHQICSPISLHTISSALFVVLRSLTPNFESWGTYHISTSGWTTKKEFAERAIWYFLDRHDIPVMIGKLNSPRPEYCILDTSRFHEVFGFKAPSWDRDLRNESCRWKELRAV